MQKTVAELISELRNQSPSQFQYLTDAQVVEHYLRENPNSISFIDFGNPVPPEYTHLQQRKQAQINPAFGLGGVTPQNPPIPPQNFHNPQVHGGYNQNPYNTNYNNPTQQHHQQYPNPNQQYPNPTMPNQYQHGQFQQNIPTEQPEEETGPWPWRTIISVLAFLFFVVRACYFNRH